MNDAETDLLVAAVDVGTLKNWGIAVNNPHFFQRNGTGMKMSPECQKAVNARDAAKLAEAVAKELQSKERFVALGFEAPLWVPAKEMAADLLTGRPEEHKNPWSAGPGAVVTAVSLAVVPWWLREIKQHLPVTPLATTDPAEWQPGILLVWEAFVPGTKNGELGRGEKKIKIHESGNPHDKDAKAAVDAFVAKRGAENWKSELPFARERDDTFSLLPGMFERFGWTFIGDASLPALVVKAQSCA